jgi:hypothetical protein
MKKRTKTPWKSAVMLKDRGFYDENNIPVGHCNETGEDLREQLRVGAAIVVANLYGGLPNHDGQYPSAEANARYIVHCVNCHDELIEALEMVRDADEDCHKDGLPTIPVIARAKIDAAIAKATANYLHATRDSGESDGQ